MKTIRFGAALAVMLGGLAGCGTLSTSDYAALQAVLKTDPEVRREAVDKCVRDTDRESATDRANMAAVINVPTARVSQVFCTRLFKGIASGRISYEELTNYKRSGDFSGLIRELQRG